MGQRNFCIIGIILVIGLQSCEKKEIMSIGNVPDNSFTEEFDQVSTAFSKGWVAINNSLPIGPVGWVQGGGQPALFSAYSPNNASDAFVGSSYLATSGKNDIISNWLISPKIWIKNGDKIIFYTRSQMLPNINAPGDSTDYGNSLSVHLNLRNDSTYVGMASNPALPSFDSISDRGDFACVFRINPGLFNGIYQTWDYAWAHTAYSLLESGAYPAQWTRFEIPIQGIPRPVRGRFAFRYNTLGAGSNGNGTGIGIDRVSYQSATN